MREVVLGGDGVRASAFFDSAASSPDGRVVVFAGSTPVDVIVDGARRTLKAERFEHAHRACAVAPDGKSFALAGESVLLVDVGTLDVLHTIRVAAQTIAYSPDGKLLACADKVVTLVDVASGQIVRELRGSRRAIVSLSFDERGHRLACGGDTKMRVFDVHKGKKVAEFDAGGHVYCAFTADTLITAGPKSAIAATDVGTLARREIGPSLYGARALVRLPSGRVALATEMLGEGPHVSVVDPHESRLVDLGPLAEMWRVDLLFERDGDVLAVSDGSNAAEIVGKPAATHTQRVEHFALSPDGSVLATGARDGTVMLWDLRAREPRARIALGSETTRGPLGRRKPTALAFDPAGKLLAVGRDDGRISIVDVARGEATKTFEAQDVGEIGAIAFSAAGDRIANTNLRCMNNVPRLRVHDLEGELQSDLRSHHFGWSLRFLDARTVRFGTAQAWAEVDLGGTEVGPLTRHRLDYILDGRDLNGASDDGAVRIDGSGNELHVWNAADGSTRYRLERKDLATATLSRDGSRIAVAAWDREAIEILATDTERVLATVPWGSWIPPEALAFSHDGRTLFAAAMDGAVVLLTL